MENDFWTVFRLHPVIKISTFWSFGFTFLQLQSQSEEKHFSSNWSKRSITIYRLRSFKREANMVCWMKVRTTALLRTLSSFLV
ncbi:uncharacterized protein LOC132614457 isoform X2 [Lycium barbarum]|uniref:uncharacterized protein LOC132614457 isoform X2 n=1 Tax=Lycium barbarum TaxID=112863 RepID=UPI00293E8340|nr:uncharacterized protein LOC132614457 isoform X2 [Lycium barbarum]